MKQQMDMMKLMGAFDTEAECRAFLEELRWPKGIECPRCGGKTISRIQKRDQFDCDSCRYQFSVMSGTIFHDSHLALPKWFVATYLICESRKGMSANLIKRIIGCSYKTAWYLCHRIRAAMKEVNELLMAGTVEVDETYVGGKKIGWGVYAGKKAKQVVIGIRQRNGDLRFFHATDAKSKTLAKYIDENISDEVDVLVTDDFAAYPQALKRAGIDPQKHKTVQHSNGVYVTAGDIHTNTVESAFSLLKRGIIGTWHRVSAKHLQAYLDEMTWRFGNRKNPYLFRDTMKLIASSNLEYKKLVA